jgi:HSP20 family protein
MALGVYLPRRLRSPWELSRIDAPVERMMQRMFSDFLSPSSTSEELLSFEPQIDVVESENEIRVTAELPGLSEENVDIELRNEGLLLRGEKKQETKSEDKEGRPRTIERMYGMFERYIPLGSEIDENHVGAEFDKGILTITLPKQAEARSVKKIKIGNEGRLTQGNGQSGQKQQSQKNVPSNVQGNQGREQPSRGA